MRATSGRLCLSASAKETQPRSSSRATKGQAKPALRPKTKRAATPRASSSVAPPPEELAEKFHSATDEEAESSPLSTASSVPSDAIPTQTADDVIEFHNTTQFLQKGTLPHPKSLSPSAILEFERCPQSYFFQYILKLRQPTNAALAKGTMAHAALEQFLGLPIPDRNLTVLHNFFRKAWSEHRRQDGYKALFANDEPAEIAWGQSGLQLLTQYYDQEPLVAAPNPVQRERWIAAKLGPEQILVRGIIDRLDLVKADDNESVVTRIVDYKTGCAPNLKYSPAMNEKIRREAFDQLIMYALLLRQYRPPSSSSPTLRYLRLLYLQSVDDGPAVAWDYDLLEGNGGRDAQLDAMEERILNVYRTIVDTLNSPDPFHAFAGCDKSFCYCHRCRTKFAPGLVWEPPAATTTE